MLTWESPMPHLYVEPDLYPFVLVGIFCFAGVLNRSERYFRWSKSMWLLATYLKEARCA